LRAFPYTGLKARSRPARTKRSRAGTRTSARSAAS